MMTRLPGDELEGGVETSQVFAPHLDQVGRARRFVEQTCVRLSVSTDVCEVAVLLTSELVTNAIIHGRSEARVTIRSDGKCVHVEVYDDNSRYPKVQAEDPEALDGRGLQILDLASAHWGVRPEDYGKVVWFGVACPPEHSLPIY